MSQNIWDQILQIFDDENIEEVLIDGSQQMLIYKKDSVSCELSPFYDEQSMIRFLQDFAISYNIRLDPLVPSNGGMLRINNSYFRWHALLSCVAKDGPLFALRRHNFSKFTIKDFCLTEYQYQCLKKLFENDIPILICGATGCGKTTFLACLIKEFAFDERILCLEHVSELPKLTPKWVSLVEKAPNLEGIGGFSLGSVLKESLRLRPQRIIIGEIRSDEAKIFLQAIDTGHNAIITTMHAGSPLQAERRLAMLSGYDEIKSILEDVNLHVCILDKNSRQRSLKSIFAIKDSVWTEV